MGILPFNMSVDIRQSAHKMAVVDANLFPAGYNNLSLDARRLASQKIKVFFDQQLPSARRLLLITEEHTRNTWYLENVLTLQEIIETAGFEVVLASFLDIETTETVVTLPTASGRTVTICYAKPLLQAILNGEQVFDAGILNNDLTVGIPPFLKQLPFPLFPSMYAGWHARRKSQHFIYTNELIHDICVPQGKDPWLMSCLFSTVDDVDINELSSREALAQASHELITKISVKYKEYGIETKPFVFIKGDAGTYGMGVTSIEDPLEVLNFNRKLRNNLAKGKNGQVLDQFILQEGVPSIHQVEGHTSEPCIYLINNEIVGGFNRVNTQKSDRENLNSQGMSFLPMETDMSLYDEISKIAGLACAKEIEALEALT